MGGAIRKVSVEGLLVGHPSSDNQAVFQQWLAGKCTMEDMNPRFCDDFLAKICIEGIDMGSALLSLNGTSLLLWLY